MKKVFITAVLLLAMFAIADTSQGPSGPIGPVVSGGGIATDGSNPPTADQPWGNNAITDLSSLELDDGVQPSPYTINQVAAPLGTAIQIESQTTAVGMQTIFKTLDSDGTDTNLSVWFALGDATFAPNFEVLQIGFDPFLPEYSIGSFKGGTGAAHPINFYMDGFTLALGIEADRDISIPSGNLLMGANQVQDVSVLEMDDGVVNAYQVSSFDNTGAGHNLLIENQVSATGTSILLRPKDQDETDGLNLIFLANDSDFSAADAALYSIGYIPGLAAFHQSFARGTGTPLPIQFYTGGASGGGGSGVALALELQEDHDVSVVSGNLLINSNDILGANNAEVVSVDVTTAERLLIVSDSSVDSSEDTQVDIVGLDDGVGNSEILRMGYNDANDKMLIQMISAGTGDEIDLSFQVNNVNWILFDVSLDEMLFDATVDLRIGGEVYLDTDLLLRQDTNEGLELRHTSAAGGTIFSMRTTDADGTDQLDFSIYGVGHIEAANTENLNIRYEETGTVFQIATKAAGTGTTRDLTLGTGSEQLRFVASTGVARMSNDMSYVSNGQGPVLVAPDAGCWRVTVDNAGSLGTTSVTCP